LPEFLAYDFMHRAFAAGAMTAVICPAIGMFLVPRRLSLIVMQCLQKDPANRPPTADALLNALDTVATASGEIRTREHKVHLPPVVKKKTPTPMKSGSVSIPAMLKPTSGSGCLAIGES